MPRIKPENQCQWESDNKVWVCKSYGNKEITETWRERVWVKADTSWETFEEFVKSKDNVKFPYVDENGEYSYKWDSLPENKKKFYFNKEIFEYDNEIEDYHKWKEQQKDWLDLRIHSTTTKYCRWHYANVKWGCNRGCETQSQHDDWKSECSKAKRALEEAMKWKYTNNQIDPKTMNKNKLRKAISKDIWLLKEQLPLDIDISENNEDTWDEDATGELMERIEKVKQIVESINGLNDKLAEWQTRIENEENANFYDEEVDPFDEEKCQECEKRLRTKKEKDEGLCKECLKEINN